MCTPGTPEHARSHFHFLHTETETGAELVIEMLTSLLGYRNTDMILEQGRALLISLETTHMNTGHVCAAVPPSPTPPPVCITRPGCTTVDCTGSN